MDKPKKKAHRNRISMMLENGEIPGCERVNGTECGAESTASQSVLQNRGKPPPMSYGTLETACSPIPTVELMYQRKVIMIVICSFTVAVLLLAYLGLNGGDKEDFQLETEITLNDVKGLEETKFELEEIVHYLRDHVQCTRLGGKLPKGILLVGPAGTGKKMLSRAVAGEAGVPLFASSGLALSAIDDPRRVRNLFKAAKKQSPCVIFIDNIDEVAGCNLNHLLVELDSFKQNNGIIVIGSTKFPLQVDKALVRPGRLDRHIVVPKPDLEGRIKILESYMSMVFLNFKELGAADDVNLSIIAGRTHGFSGADLATLVMHANFRASKDGAKEVSMAHLKYAVDDMIRSAEAWNYYIQTVMDENPKRKTRVYDSDSSMRRPQYMTYEQTLPV